MPQPDKTHLLLVNPISGGGRALASMPNVQHQLELYGINYRTHITSSEQDLISQLKSATESTVYLLAGDGSLRAAAEAIIKLNLPIRIAPLPGGRGNDFCSVLGINKDIEKALLKSLINPTEVCVDVMLVNDQHVALGAISIGIDASAAKISYQIQQRGIRWLKGAPLYIFSALVALSGWRSVEVRVKMDDQSHQHKKIWLFVVSNSGQFGGGMKIAPHSRLQDGKLEIISVGEVTKVDFLKTFPKVFYGKHMNHPKLEHFEVQQVEINTPVPILAFADGEPIIETPLKISVLPNSLKILK